MHEVSLAESLLKVALTHLPSDQHCVAIYVVAGPLRGIDPEAMKWAWEAVRAGTPLSDSELKLTLTPWKMHCGECLRHWETPELAEHCQCGSSRVTFESGDELQLVALDVEEKVAGKR